MTVLIPRRTEWRKQHRPTRSGLSKGGTRLAFGSCGIQAFEPAYATNRQVEAAHVIMTHHVKRGGKIWVNVFLDRPLIKKVLGLRMGSGKGPAETQVADVKPGCIMFEVDGTSEELTREAMLCAMYKLSMKTRSVIREEEE